MKGFDAAVRLQVRSPVAGVIRRGVGASRNDMTCIPIRLLLHHPRKFARQMQDPRTGPQSLCRSALRVLPLFTRIKPQQREHLAQPITIKRAERACRRPTFPPASPGAGERGDGRTAIILRHMELLVQLLGRLGRIADLAVFHCGQLGTSLYKRGEPNCFSANPGTRVGLLIWDA